MYKKRKAKKVSAKNSQCFNIDHITGIYRTTLISGINREEKIGYFFFLNKCELSFQLFVWRCTFQLYLYKKKSFKKTLFFKKKCVFILVYSSKNGKTKNDDSNKNEEENDTSSSNSKTPTTYIIIKVIQQTICVPQVQTQHAIVCTVS